MEHIEEAGIIRATAPVRCRRARLRRKRSPSSKIRPRRPRPGAWRRRLDERAICSEGDEIYVLRQSIRCAARTVPFVATGDRVRSPRSRRGSWPENSLSSFGLRPPSSRSQSASKDRCFPFARFPGVDTRARAGNAFRPARSWDLIALFRSLSPRASSAAGTKVPRTGTVFVSVRDIDKPRVLETMRLIGRPRFKISATAAPRAISIARASRRRE